MAELGQRLGLAAEALDKRRITGELRPEDLQGNIRVQPLIVGTVNR
jgi:hypothetical protein